MNEDMKISEAVSRYAHLHRSSAFALIRTRARAVMKHEKVCESCGYSKHVEIAHIKDISDFEETALLSEVNSKSNLVALCPNCHWEFDKGRLEIRGVTKKSKKYKKYYCPVCKTEKNNGSKTNCMCKKCSFKKREKIAWPKDEDLISMVRESNFLQVGKKLGVSDNAIRKRLKTRGLLMLI